MDGHLALKRLACRYLKDKGKKVLIERNFYGLVPDLIDVGEKIVLECGNTNPNKVLSYLSLEIDEVGIMSSPLAEGKDVRIYWFEKTTKFGSYLKDRVAQLKKVHRKYHRGNR